MMNYVETSTQEDCIKAIFLQYIILSLTGIYTHKETLAFNILT